MNAAARRWGAEGSVDKPRLGETVRFLILVPPPNHPFPTIKQIAARSGVSIATVSYALRNSPKVRADTRQLVQSLAREMGYRPNPQVTALMTHIRQARGVSESVPLAFVWVHATRVESAADTFAQETLSGARERAVRFGYRLEEFWLRDRGMTPGRLSRILGARGIEGVVFSPVWDVDSVSLPGWEWDRFAHAAIGYAPWKPEVPRAAQHAYAAMQLMLERLRARGFSRPAFFAETTFEARTQHTSSAAFLLHHPAGLAEGGRLRLEASRAQLAKVTAWCRRARFDVLIVNGAATAKEITLRCKLPPAVPLAILDWHARDGFPMGVALSNGQIAAMGVDLVVNQLMSNERGLPANPPLILHRGQWAEI